ncbi:hypothetical protein K1T71_003012 [Dendrolimus kikuchii]|uniref:Uncharacterized protein n=1 Tax=Dendrolimus kikuchii TaxID=765133 RepID=A0ACC1DBF5_9NEOP|nr:hypothetical protein K1T71_003012 [Dendrolimus kikuchii]
MLQPTKRKRGESWTEEAMIAALNAVQRGRLGQRAAATRYNIPRRTLRDHIKVGSVTKRFGRKPIFTDIQESDLATRIKRFAKIGVPLTPKFIRKQAFLFCERYDIKHNFNETKRIAGADWLRQFLKRNPSISKRKPQIMNPARAQKLNKPIVEEHFQTIKQLYNELDIPQHPERLYNMDEKGCRITLHKQQTVLAEKGSKRVHLIAPEHAENVTIAMCVNAIGTAIPPMILFKGQRQRPDLTENLPAGTLVRMAPKGSMTSDLFVEFIQHLGKFKVTSKCLLIFDGAKCHLSIEALDEADKNGIVLYCLPSNTTHELQPLDKSINRSYEHHWDEACINFLYANADKKMTKATFNKIFSQVWPKCMTHSNIVNGFKATDLFPFNPEAIPEEAYAPSILTEIPYSSICEQPKQDRRGSISDTDNLLISSEIPCTATCEQPMQNSSADDYMDNFQARTERSGVTFEDKIVKYRIVDYSSSTECSEERRNLSPSVLAAGCSGLQKSNREVSPVLSIASTVSELDFSYNQNNSKLTVADVYSYSSSEEENESQYFLYKGHITPKKQTINNPLRDTNETNSVGFICSNENEDNLPLSTFKKRKNKTPFQEFLATPNYAVEKTKQQRKKAINYKGQRITKDLFTQGIDKKTKKVKDISMIQPIKKQKKDLRDNYTPRDKEINTKKINKKWNKLNEKEEKMDNNKENDDLEAWYCHACCESEMLDMRQCTNCRKWYHEDCVGLTKADKEFICSDCQINTNS